MYPSTVLYHGFTDIYWSGLQCSIYRCECSKCCVMERDPESRWCREIEHVAARMQVSVYSCTTDHPLSRLGCHDVWMLRIACLAYKEQHVDMQQNGNRYRNMCSSLYVEPLTETTFSWWRYQKWDWQIQGSNYYLDKSTVCVFVCVREGGGVLFVLFFGVIQVCVGALSCRHHQYTVYRLLVTLCWGYMGKDITVPLPSFALLRIRQEYPSQDYRGFHAMQEWPGIIIGFDVGSYAPWLPVLFLVSPFLTLE